MEIKIALWPYEKKENKFRDFVSRCIVFFTGKEFTHVGWWIDGYIYDSSVWEYGGKTFHGARKTEYSKWPEDEAKPKVWVEPVKPLSDHTIQLIKMWCEESLGDEMPYNFLSLVTFAIVAPFRWFWNWIGWVPFSAELFGEVCSTYVDDSAYECGFDIFPDMKEDLAVPGDFLETSTLKPTSAPE
jgi:hypothetical protein